jgi:nitrate reductase alpha subunit
VGQEKLRPQTGWQPLAFALDWQRPARHMNSTSYFYNHSSQWRYETSPRRNCCRRWRINPATAAT